jgi:hypothetical protein
MRLLTCIHHPRLRWLCKTEGVNSIGQYTGQRNIFFQGAIQNDGSIDVMIAMEKGGILIVPECACPPSDLRFAPEDKGD